MVLVEEDVQQVMLLGLLAQPKRAVVDVVVMIVKDHLTEEGCVEHDSIDRDGGLPYRIADSKVSGQESARQADEDDQQQENVGIEVHTPPEAIAEAGQPFPPFTERILLGAVDFNEDQAEQSAKDWRQDCDLQVLLYPVEKQ